MNLNNLKINRLLYKMEDQNLFDSPVYISTIVNKNNNYRNKYISDISQAKEILTGTVIMNCIIITSSLPNRVEIADNDIKFFDNTFLRNGEVIGDTSRLIFTKANREEGTFILEKRVSVNSDNDSVLSLYVTESLPGGHNWLFIGRDGRDNQETKRLSVFRNAIYSEAADVPAVGKPYGSYSIEYNDDTGESHVSFFTGASKNLIGSGLTGFSSFMICGEGGWSGLGYKISETFDNIVLYVVSDTGEINVDARITINESTGGRMSVGSVTDAGPMTNTNGTVGDIVFNTSDSKFYGCTVSGTPATWVALN